MADNTTSDLHAVWIQCMKPRVQEEKARERRKYFALSLHDPDGCKKTERIVGAGSRTNYKSDLSDPPACFLNQFKPGGFCFHASPLVDVLSWNSRGKMSLLLPRFAQRRANAGQSVVFLKTQIFAMLSSRTCHAKMLTGFCHAA